MLPIKKNTNKLKMIFMSVYLMRLFLDIHINIYLVYVDSTGLKLKIT